MIAALKGSDAMGRIRGDWKGNNDQSARNCYNGLDTSHGRPALSTKLCNADVFGNCHHCDFVEHGFASASCALDFSKQIDGSDTCDCTWGENARGATTRSPFNKAGCSQWNHGQSFGVALGFAGGHDGFIPRYSGDNMIVSGRHWGDLGKGETNLLDARLWVRGRALPSIGLPVQTTTTTAAPTTTTTTTAAPVQYVKVWKATGRPGSCGWSTSPTYCTLGEPDRIQSCWKNGVVGYCEVGKNCGGFFTDAEMAKNSGQHQGSCTLDKVVKSCNSDDCSVPDPASLNGGNQAPKTTCSAMSSPDSMSCSGEAFIQSRPDKFCKGTKTCGVKDEAACRKLCGDAGAQCAGFSNYCAIGHPNCLNGLNGCRCHHGPRKSGCRGCTARVTFASSCT